MGGQGVEKTKKHMCVGLLAHVDAGKTTLSEALLYESGARRALGRVDHGDAFLDNFSLERERGITIFSKQAVFALGDVQVTLLDTPGHVDFSAEMERTLQVLDCAVLVISGADGVQGHTETLWRLLGRYRVPVFLFVNKMDQPGTDRERLLVELEKRLDAGCLDFSRAEERLAAGDRDFQEQLALLDEKLLERYLAAEEWRALICDADVRALIARRRLFPCWFGSALKLEGIREFLDGLGRFAPVFEDEGRADCQDAMPLQGGTGGGAAETAQPQNAAPLRYKETDGGAVGAAQVSRSNFWNPTSRPFAARVFKITRDAQGKRLTHLKVTGGSLRVRTQLAGDEKVDQIRIYSGERYETVEEAEAGCICAVTGLSHTRAGQGLGAEPDGQAPALEPVLNYQLLLPEGCDVHTLYAKLKVLEEESPELHLVWNRQLNELHAQLMGEVQTEILRELILERCGAEVAFGPGKILYRETIAAPVEGVGHFEPLRHYAEVHLLMEPGPRGSGLQFASSCSEDQLDRNWQRLVLTHLAEREHPGVLTGAPITDMKITLAAGRAHQKHTEGGDFRQATYRAVRQGLRRAQSILLEPVYSFRLELPAELVGRAMSDIQRMDGSFALPEQEGETAVICGEAPVATMQSYPSEFAAYTRGRGRISLELKGYLPCHNAEEVIAETGYDPEADTENPTGSVFCAHGAGFVVPWDEVEAHMHLPSVLKPEQEPQDAADAQRAARTGRRDAEPWREAGRYIGDKELEEIFVRTFGPIREKNAFAPQEGGRRSRAWNGAEALQGGTKTGAGTAQNTGETVRGTPQGAKKADSDEMSAVDGQNGSAAHTDASGYPKPEADRQPARAARPGNAASSPQPEEYLLVDGYNIIFAWDELKALAADNLDGARGRLLDILSNYQGFTKKKVIAVFDAYRVQGHPCEEFLYHNVFVVYTKEAQTADQYIERMVHEIGRKHRVTVATSDRLEQIIIWGQGGVRLSAQGFKEEIERVNHQIRTEHLERQTHEKNRLADYMPGGRPT